MLPDAVPLTADRAAAWVAAGTPRWITRQLPAALWVLALVVSIVTDTTQCTPLDPSVCGPDHVFAWYLVIAIATPVLLLWMPLLGCSVGIVAAFVDLRYDPVFASRVAFGSHGAVCLVVGVLLIRSRWAQREIAGQVSVPIWLPATDVNPGWSIVRAATAALMVPVAAGSFWYYHRVSTAEEQHLNRAQVVVAEVVAASSDDSTITLAVNRGGDDPRRLVLDVLDTHAYRVGDTTPVLVDPQDRTWNRLVAEPYDATGWMSLGYGACALIVLCVGRDLQRRRAIRMILTTPQPGVQVRAARIADEVLLLTSDEEMRPVATLLVVEPPRPDGDDELLWDESENAHVFGELWRGERQMDEFQWDAEDGLIDTPDDTDAEIVEPAVLVGALYDGGWNVLVTAEQILVPKRPLRLNDKPHRSLSDLKQRLPLPFRDESQSADDRALPGVPVEAADAGAMLDVPAVARPLWRKRLLGRLYVVVALVAAPCAVLWLAEGWYQRGLAVLLGGQLLLAGSRRSGQQVRLTQHQLEISGPWTTVQIPWDRVHGARRDGEALLLAWEPDTVLELGPLELVGSSLPAEDVAKKVGAAVSGLRERAVAAGQTHREVGTLGGSARRALAVYGLLCATALLLVSQRI